jgi:hypothetical protein
MKIIDSRKMGVEFRNIKVGETFLDDENCLMMRMEETEDGFNSVDLESGEIAQFSYTAKVTPVKTVVASFE